MSAEPALHRAPPGQHRAARSAQLALVEFENTLPPRAFMDQIALEAARGNQVLSSVMAGSPTAVHLQAQSHLQPFTARPLAPDVVLYQGAASPAGRNLLVAFTGRKNRLMMPLPLFLQVLDAATWDVLILRDRSVMQFRNGVFGLATSFPELAGRIATLAAGYRARVAIGTSLGALAAIRLALLIPDMRGISVGGRPANDNGGILAGERPAPAFDPICACLPPARRDLLYFYGEEHELDAVAARHCAALSGGVTMPLAGHDRHFVLWELHQAGRLGLFLQTVLDPAIASPDMAATLKRRGFGRSALQMLIRRLAGWIGARLR
jgi:hypothetical protein